MKKLIAIAVLGLSVATGWSQGTILFQNTGVTFKTTHDKRVYDVDGVTPLVGVNYVAALYYVEGTGGDLSTPATGTMALGADGTGLAAFRVPTTTSKGYWLNGAVGNARTLVGVTAGETATLQVRVWDITRFASYAEAVAGGGIYGKSETFTYTVPQPGAPVNETYLNDLRSFQLVPEPSTIALGVLGLGSLFLFRRRRSA